jgi:hypothetical protein
MSWAQAFSGKYPELAIYLALGVGFAVGNVKLKDFSLAALAPCWPGS